MKTTPVRHSVSTRLRGFALPAAIFLMVVLAALALFLVQITTHQQSGHAADIQGLRAYQAARAGMEWGVYNFLRPPQVCGNESFVPAGASGLQAFTVTVTCVPTVNDEGGIAITSARIVATACNQPAAGACPPPNPGPNYIEREVAVVVSRGGV
jgi:MSHA biogenesis protein MshP